MTKTTTGANMSQSTEIINNNIDGHNIKKENMKQKSSSESLRDLKSEVRDYLNPL